MSQDKEREALNAAHRLYEWAFNGWEACKAECDRLRDEVAALASQQAVKGEPLTEWEIRGMLARLKCWHRLTEQEADQLVQFAMQSGIHSRGEGES